MGILGSIFGGGDTTQETVVDIVNENNNEFSPNVIVNVGLEAIGASLRSIGELITGGNNRQVSSIDQAGLNVASSIDGAGLNIAGGLIDASENVETGLDGLGANLGFAAIAGAGILVLGRAVFRD